MLRIRRIEFRVAEIPILLIPVFLIVDKANIFTTYVFWEGVFVFFLLFSFGDMINCLSDRELDAKYKKHLSQAVYELGVPFVTWQVIISGALSIILAFHLAWILDRWLIAFFITIGVFLGSQYSVKPLYFKSKGLWQLLILWSIIFVGPMLYISLLVTEFPPLPVIIISMAYGALQMGIILINTAEDYPEDLAASIQTVIVSMGLHKGIALAHILTMISGIVYLGTLIWLYLQLNSFWIWATCTLVLTVVAWLFVQINITSLYFKIRKLSLDKSIILVKKKARAVPLWLPLTSWGSLSFVFTVFLSK